MKQAVTFLLCVAGIMAGCSQPSTRVPVYQYAGKNTGAGSLGFHTVRSGDTLWTIANSYRVDLRDMLDMNALHAPYTLKSGQRIKIPAPIHYTAHRGDTLYKVSRMFDTTTTELARLNSLKSPYILKEGQSVRLPSKHANTAPIIKEKPQSITVVNGHDKIEREILPSTIKPPQKIEVAEVPKTQPQTQQTPMSLSSKGFLKPVTGKIISGFGTKSDGLHNDGINIKAPRGESVRAADQGVVVYSGQQIEGYGNLILLKHADGYMTAYAHMDKSLVKKGDKIKRGQVVGTVGSTGHVDTPQLHFEIRKGKSALDPAPLLRG